MLQNDGDNTDKGDDKQRQFPVQALLQNPENGDNTDNKDDKQRQFFREVRSKSVDSLDKVEIRHEVATPEKVGCFNRDTGQTRKTRSHTLNDLDDDDENEGKHGKRRFNFEPEIRSILQKVVVKSKSDNSVTNMGNIIRRQILFSNKHAQWLAESLKEDHNRLSVYPSDMKRSYSDSPVVADTPNYPLPHAISDELKKALIRQERLQQICLF